MNLSDLNKATNEIPENQREAILNIIEHKTNNDMEKLIAKFDHQDKKFNNIQNEIKIIYWVIGIGMAVIATLLAIKK